MPTQSLVVQQRRTRKRMISSDSADRDRVEKLIMTEMRDSKSQVLLGITVLCIVLVISPIIILLVRMVTRTLQVHTYIHTIYIYSYTHTHKLLKIEQYS